MKRADQSLRNKTNEILPLYKRKRPAGLNTINILINDFGNPEVLAV